MRPAPIRLGSVRNPVANVPAGALVTCPNSFRSKVLCLMGGAFLMAVLVVPCPLLAQQQGETKIPKIGKIIGGNQQQAFTGKVQSVDTKLNLLT